MPAISLEGKTAIVTGASSGFGKVIAKALQDEGVQVCRRRPRAWTVWKATSPMRSTSPIPIRAREFVAAAVEALGGLDFLVNNAGGAIGRYPFWESSGDDEESMIVGERHGLLRMTRLSCARP